MQAITILERAGYKLTTDGANISIAWPSTRLPQAAETAFLATLKASKPAAIAFLQQRATVPTTPAAQQFSDALNSNGGPAPDSPVAQMLARKRQQAQQAESPAPPQQSAPEKVAGTGGEIDLNARAIFKAQRIREIEIRIATGDCTETQEAALITELSMWGGRFVGSDGRNMREVLEEYGGIQK